MNSGLFHQQRLGIYLDWTSIDILVSKVHIESSIYYNNAKNITQKKKRKKNPQMKKSSKLHTSPAHHSWL